MKSDFRALNALFSDQYSTHLCSIHIQDIMFRTIDSYLFVCCSPEPEETYFKNIYIWVSMQDTLEITKDMIPFKYCPRCLLNGRTNPVGWMRDLFEEGMAFMWCRTPPKVCNWKRTIPLEPPSIPLRTRSRTRPRTFPQTRARPSAGHVPSSRYPTSSSDYS